MLALTLKHPWPFAICHMGKRIENRRWKPWRSILGGFIAIHGGTVPESHVLIRDIVDEGRDLIRRFGKPEGFDDIKLRDACMTGIVAIVRVIGIIDGLDDQGSDDPWFEGPYGWKLDDVFMLPKPVACKGARGLWEIPYPEVNDVIEQCGTSRLGVRTDGRKLD